MTTSTASSMARIQRCELNGTEETQWGGASPVAIARANKPTPSVCQVTSIPDSELKRLGQVDNGHISLMAGRWRTTPTASPYPLRNTQARSYHQERMVGPDTRLATSHTKVMATNTGTRSDATHERRNGVGNCDAGSLHAVWVEVQAEQDHQLEDRMLTVQGVPTTYLLCANLMHALLRRTHGDWRRLLPEVR